MIEGAGAPFAKLVLRWVGADGTSQSVVVWEGNVAFRGLAKLGRAVRNAQIARSVRSTSARVSLPEKKETQAGG